MKSTSISVVLFAVATAMWAQPRADRIESLRIAFITEELALSPQESQSFWPVHQAFELHIEGKRDALKALKASFDSTNPSNREFESFLLEMSELRKEMVDMEAQHLRDVADILGAERALKLTELQRELARRIRERIGRTEFSGHIQPNLKNAPRSRHQ